VTGQGFGADVDRLGAEAAELGELAERARRIVASLREVLDEAPAPWGGDAVGESFGAAHERPAAAALEHLDGVATGLDEFGARFAAAAREYQAADEDAADDARRAAPGG
jgi:uncharacterized protein YukE